MSDEQLRRAMAIFAQMRRLAEHERPSFLERECDGDEVLRAEVESLRANDSDTSDVFGLKGLDTARAVGANAEDETRIGPYWIRETIGEGGMGTVYLAEQREPIHRKVALKVIKLGMNTREVVTRFEIERQALAMLDHRGIAQVHDAGTTESGRPYFVMEYVNGVPITQHCIRHQLGTRERLSLFVDVCLAVQHAHQKGIIHRDLKPSNILVKLEDGKAISKVIDFGIAKATNRSLSEETILTEVGQLIGTPAYMSPEQAGGTALDIDTRADVYSLGVLLYELLVGVTPFEDDTLRQAGFAELQQIIREVDPPKPSTRLNHLGEKSNEIAQQRQSDSRTLLRELRGDLDWIVMMAMAKHRDHRYSTVSELSSDIGRYLRAEPVIAGPPSRSYILRKYVARHRVAMLVAVMIFVSLIVGIVGVSLGYLEASREKEVAVAEANKAKAVTKFLEDMLGQANPEIALQPETNMEQLLDWVDGRIDEEFRGMEEVATGVRSTIGRAYECLGLYDKARPLLLEALDEQERLVGSDSLEYYKTLTSAIWVIEETATAQSSLRRALLRRLAEQIPQMFALDHPELKSILEDSRIAFLGGKYDEVVLLMKELVGRYRKDLEGDTPRLRVIADFLRLYAGTLAAQRIDVENGLLYLNEAFELQSEVLSEGHPEIVRTAKFVIEGYLAASPPRAQEARELAQTSIDVHMTRLSPTHWMRGRAEFQIGRSFMVEGNYQRAATQMILGLDMMEPTLHPASPKFHRYVRTLIEVYDVWGRPDEAAKWRQHPGAWNLHADPGTRARWKPHGEPLARTDTALKRSLESWITANETSWKTGKPVAKNDQATFVEAIVLARSAELDVNDPLALVYADLVSDQVRALGHGSGDVWEPILRDVIHIRRAQLPGHGTLSDSLMQLADCLARSNRLKDVEPLVQESLTLLEALRASELWGETVTPRILECRQLLDANLPSRRATTK